MNRRLLGIILSGIMMVCIVGCTDGKETHQESKVEEIKGHEEVDEMIRQNVYDMLSDTNHNEIKSYKSADAIIDKESVEVTTTESRGYYNFTIKMNFKREYTSGKTSNGVYVYRLKRLKNKGLDEMDFFKDFFIDYITCEVYSLDNNTCFLTSTNKKYVESLEDTLYLDGKKFKIISKSLRDEERRIKGSFFKTMGYDDDYVLSLTDNTNTLNIIKEEEINEATKEVDTEMNYEEREKVDNETADDCYDYMSALVEDSNIKVSVQYAFIVNSGKKDIYIHPYIQLACNLNFNTKEEFLNYVETEKGKSELENIKKNVETIFTNTRRARADFINLGLSNRVYANDGKTLLFWSRMNPESSSIGHIIEQ